MAEITLASDGGSAPKRTLQINPVHMGYDPDLNCDSIESLIEYGEGEQHRCGDSVVEPDKAHV